MSDEEKKRYLSEMLSKNELVSPEQLEMLFGSKKESGSLVLEQAPQQPLGNTTVIFSPILKSRRSDVQDFVSFYNARYRTIAAMLQNRRELTNLTSISRLAAMRSSERVSLIGMVMDKQVSKHGNIILELEDSTGTSRVIVTKNNPELFSTASDIVFDEVIGVTGSTKDRVVFANTIIFPEVPVANDLRASPNNVNAAFLSDIHVGSSQFLGNEFDRFLKWINGKQGSPLQRAEARKTAYIFIAGDVVDGVGVYQNQQEELTIKDVREQYSHLAELLSEIPQHISIIMCAGNHDAVSGAEPQPIFNKMFSSKLFQLPNLTLVSNPGMVNIERGNGFEGINVMLYHGYSFDYYIANVDSLRQQGGYDRPDLVMKFLLKRTHFAPAHTSTLYVPNPDYDYLTISTVPDILHTGHVHRAAVANYRGITLVNSSCWQGMTPFQERLGHKPEPARAPLINLHTRKAKILKFGNS